MNHIEVVSILKDLPVGVRMVCARRSPDSTPYRLIDTSQDKAAFAARVSNFFFIYITISGFRKVIAMTYLCWNLEGEMEDFKEFR